MLDDVCVSIITCVFNGNNYIDRLFNSVLSIKYPKIQHIIINDGSTENLDPLVDNYKVKALYTNNIEVKYIKTANHGLGASTNLGLQNVDGDFFTWINCDDWYLCNNFKTILDLFDKNIDVVHFNYIPYKLIENKLEPSSGVKISKQLWTKYSNAIEVRKMLYSGNLNYIHYFIRTSAYKNINKNLIIDPFRWTQDVQLAYQIYPNLNVKFLPLAIVAFYDRDSSLFNSHKISWTEYFDSAVRSINMLSICDSMKNDQIKCAYCGMYSIKITNYFIDKKYDSLFEIYGKFKECYRSLPRHMRKYINKKCFFYYLISKSKFLQFIYKLVSK